ncbi:hypothetical protein CBR_g22487 [Chara braunii]|uniref:IFT140 first beta-propeller domain-containing protein n=1 Tax=Chara braunii TaxID=69332 RepID=A0A388L2X6_CHABU|nr:hypothetical protein CBR_g22487 [Chara braunii]|eukprot:GBG76608.1 hypothetical protein CBR_g22487 [Chara braunii]
MAATTTTTQPPAWAPGGPVGSCFDRQLMSSEMDDRFGVRRVRKHRKSVDYSSTIVPLMQTRMFQRDIRDARILQPTTVAALDQLPPVAYPNCPSMSVTTKFVRASANKVRCSINRVLWTPTGRRLVTGSQSGEFTLWNGQSFNFEMILQAHDNAVRSMIWSHNGNWMVTGDDAGCIKYWQSNMNNVKANKVAHKEAVRDLSFASTDLKFCSCSDDRLVKVWDFARCKEERSLSGHLWDVKCVDWHPQKGLLVSGSKDNQVKLWDAKTGQQLRELHCHKDTVLQVKWNKNGNWLLTASRDQLIKLLDLRTLKEIETYKGHRREVTSLAWHPIHEDLFVSGSYDGAIMHWLVGHEEPQAEAPNAHESGIWDLAWHPAGHVLCSGSNDHTTKFWCRSRPGEGSRDSKHNSFQRHLTEQMPCRSGGDGGTDALGSGGILGRPDSPDSGAAIPGVGMAVQVQAPADPMLQEEEQGGEDEETVEALLTTQDPVEAEEEMLPQVGQKRPLSAVKEESNPDPGSTPAEDEPPQSRPRTSGPQPQQEVFSTATAVNQGPLLQPPPSQPLPRPGGPTRGGGLVGPRAILPAGLAPLPGGVGLGSAQQQQQFSHGQPGQQLVQTSGLGVQMLGGGVRGQPSGHGISGIRALMGPGGAFSALSRGPPPRQGMMGADQVGGGMFRNGGALGHQRGGFRPGIMIDSRGSVIAPGPFGPRILHRLGPMGHPPMGGHNIGPFFAGASGLIDPRGRGLGQGSSSMTGPKN